LIGYDYNPQNRLFQNGIELNNVSFLVGVDGGVVSCQSKPNGIWSSEKEKMFWRVKFFFYPFYSLYFCIGCISFYLVIYLFFF